jgi:four helix bundle protein
MTRPPAARFEDLIVWQKMHALTLSIYTVTRSFPKEELFGLSAQMRRAAVSVGANIAEGFSKKGKPDKARYMNVAQGSLEEVRYYFILARDLGYLPPSHAGFPDVDEVGRLLGGYLKGILALRASNS